MHKDTVFYFNFLIENETRTVMRGFLIKELAEHWHKLDPDIDDFEYFIDSDTFLEVWSDIESDHGVHDWVTSPSDEVDGIGFNSYEVNESEIDIVMEKWQSFFMSLVGRNNVSSVAAFDSQNGTDFDIYNKVKEYVSV